MNTNIRKFSDAEILNKIASLPSFKGFPSGKYIVGMQSLEDAFNTFDDKFYIFENTGSALTKDKTLQKFLMVTSGTTNAGVNGLMKYDTYNPHGVAVLKTNEIYYDVWKFGLHRGKIEALRQVKPFLISRDGDKDQKVEEGVSIPVMCGINFHSNTYNLASTEVKEIIGAWSLGCQVCNNMKDYLKIIAMMKPQKSVTYILLKEW
jgi:hypothetical protein